jgi:cell division protein FtsQ
MDDRGRLAQSLIGMTRWPARLFNPACRMLVRSSDASERRAHIMGLLDRWAVLLDRRLPTRAAGSIAAAILILSSLAYGIVKGDHLTIVGGYLKGAGDWVANGAGLRIASVALTGNARVSREEVLATAGVNGTASLIFLDVDGARQRLKSNPWIADATVLKLYPRELQIRINERVAFALWQKDRAVSVIAEDGTVLEPYVEPGLIRLPLVVGTGAQLRAKELFALLDRHPELRDTVRASILVSERRWNLRFKNGIEVLLPETGTASALEMLTALARKQNLITRDVVMIDLRLSDRVTVRLSDAAAQARIDARKEQTKKKAGNA